MRAGETKRSARSWRSWGRAVKVAASLVVMAVVVAACGSSSSSSNAAPAAASSASGLTGSLVIAVQPDLGYSPLYIVDQEGWLKQAMPHVSVTWETLNSGSAMETGMLSGSIDVGAGGVAPFLLGWAKGVGWKLVTSLGESDLWLVVKPQITSFKDITPSDRIAVVAPTSIQAIILKAAAQKYLGNPNALDQNLTILSHPVAYQAFKSGTIQGALDAPPFQQEEVAAGGHVLLKSYSLFGPSTFNSAFALPSYYDSHKQIIDVLFAQVKRAVAMLNSDPSEAARIISAYEHGTLSVAAAKADITSSSEHWTITPHGYLAYAKFMKSIGLISKAPTSMSQIEFPTLAATPGD
jgi:NitT/TauT family transport system substrate-binding protein